MRSAASASLYVESSGVLTWLLGEPRGEEARSLLSVARRVLTSELTLIECDRALIRAETLGDVLPARRAEITAIFRAAAARWDVLKLDDEVVGRARQPFPKEPIRTLDAIHLAKRPRRSLCRPRSHGAQPRRSHQNCEPPSRPGRPARVIRPRPERPIADQER